VSRAGRIPRVKTKWDKSDYIGMVKSRATAFRMDYSVEPGVYAVGMPDEKSDIFVSANYKLSFDTLRKELEGLNAWILVIDTKGINVWCAAGKGTFGTDEIIFRIKSHKLDDLVGHKRIVLPQLGAPGVDAPAVQKQTGFRVYYGPVRASDIRDYIGGNYKAAKEMRRVKFGILDRLILTPIELNPVISKISFLALAVLPVAGIKKDGIMFDAMINEGLPLVGLLLQSALSGSFLTPVLLPFLPFRSFALKGLVAGAVVTGLSFAFVPVFKSANIFFKIFGMTAFSALSSYLALQFTGASTYTSISGVKKEIGTAMPLYKTAGVISLLSYAVYKIKSAGIV
jgi:acetyl-CoA decarbonylase/synthase complex subunit gamma